MAALERLSDLLKNLPNATDIVPSLEELQTLLTTISADKLASLVPSLSFAALFEYLYTDDEKQLACCCKVLEYLLQPVQPSALIPSFKDELLKGIQSQSVHIVGLCLTQILRVVDEDVGHLVNHTDIIEAVVQLLASDLPKIASDSSKCLIKIGSNPEGTKVLFGNRIATTLSNIIKINATIRCRVYEILVGIIIASPDSLNFLSSNHSVINLLDMMVLDMSPQNADILTKLNVLEFAIDLVSCRHGYQYLDDGTFIGAMEDSLEDALNESMLSNGYMKFFGSICYLQPDLINSRFRNFINVVFTSILRRSPHLLPIAVESLGLIGSTQPGKLALDRSGESMAQCMPVIGELTQQPSIELRLKALQSIQQLLSLPDKESKDNAEVAAIMERWFSQLYNKDPVAQIISICQQPFPEIKLPAFSVIKCLAASQWGQNVLKNNPGFQEYILDRSEQLKEGMVAKYEVVQILVSSATAQAIFGNVYYMRLRRFEKEGPYYREAVPQISYCDE